MHANPLFLDQFMQQHSTLSYLLNKEVLKGLVRGAFASYNGDP